MLCPLCQQDGPSSVDHIIPQWLTPVLPQEGAFTHRQQGQSDPELEWTHPRRVEITVSVCRDCNSGWLSDLENAAKPVIEDLVAGRPTSLNRTKQQRLAAWANKTLLMLGLRQPQARRPSPGALRTLYESRGVPGAGRQFWLGSYLCDEEIIVHEWRTLDLASGPQVGASHGRAYLSTLAIGRMVVHGFYSDHPDGAELVLAPNLRQALLPVWPAGAKLSWPPGRIFARQDLTTMADSWAQGEP